MTAKTVKTVASKKPKTPRKKTTKPKVVVPHTVPPRTLNSAAFVSLKWKPVAIRTIGYCCKRGCKETANGVFCAKHKKIIRKRQLKLNNIPWREKAKNPDYVRDQPHLVYAGRATQLVLRNRPLALKVVKAGTSTIKTVKELDAAIAAAKEAVKHSKPTHPDGPRAKKVAKVHKTLEVFVPLEATEATTS